MTTANPAPRLSIRQQAEYIEALVLRCSPDTGAHAGSVWLSLEDIDVEVLSELAKRLRRMAPYEPGIRRLVVGR